MIAAVHVVVPAHDEEETISRCLDSIGAAAHRVGLPTTATVVADSCTDATVEISLHAGADVLPLDARNVGVARDAGVRRALERTAAHPARVWIATTDADSTVPEDWLTGQLGCGAELAVGRAEPDPATLSAPLLRAWRVRHGPAEHRLRVHGANLGCTGAAYLAAGGFPPVAEHEDVAFVRAAIAAGVPWTSDVPAVRTSGRTQGRTPGGFAGYLRGLNDQLNDQLSDQIVLTSMTNR